VKRGLFPRATRVVVTIGPNRRRRLHQKPTDET
jgi:hypothetical protein